MCSSRNLLAASGRTAGCDQDREKERRGAIMLSRIIKNVGACVVLAGVTRAYTTQDCANQVPYAEVQRGKASFWAGCTGAVPGCLNPGQFSSIETNKVYGCQTCVITETWAEESVFAVYWASGLRDQLGGCPTSFDYGSFYQTKFGGTPVAVVTAASISDDTKCGDGGGGDGGWFYNGAKGKCYFKSDRYSLATSWNDAGQRCALMGASLVALESGAESRWVVHNLLWVGFMGETYTGLWKPLDGSWSWQAGGGQSVGTFSNASYQDWITGLSYSSAYPSTNPADQRSCMEIYPNEPKAWNPFACFVNKQFVCEKASAY